MSHISQISILIVEDELIAAESLAFDLRRNNYKVTAITNSGKKAIESVKKQSPDLILMDIHIRGNLDGIETAKIIQQDYCIPIIYLTAFNDRKTLERIQKQQPDYLHLNKPVKFSVLDYTIKNIAIN